MEECKYAVFYSDYYDMEQVSKWLNYDDALMFYSEQEDKRYMHILKDVTPEKE